MSKPYQRLSSCLAVALLLLLLLGAKAKDGDMDQNGNSPTTDGAKDPGPRPIGAAIFLIDRGINGVNVPVTAQPPQPGGDINSPLGAGAPLQNLTFDQGVLWGNALANFGELTTVNGAKDPKTGRPTLPGLGPGFDGNSCFMCHAQPAVGGSSPGPGTLTFPVNPQIAVATLDGANNTVPFFITPNGPVREPHFVRNPDGSLDGSVHQLYTIAGRSDAPPGCALPQPDFAAEAARNNLVFRIATPTFGAGFVETVSDATLRANLRTDAREKEALGIRGHFNIAQSDNTIARFGWKAQEKSLETFSGEAANVESGITNELSPNEKTDGGCATNATPEDNTHLISPSILGIDSLGDDASLVSSAVENFTIFMRLNSAPSQCDFASGLAPFGFPLCAPLSASALRGQVLFGAPKNGGVGCVLCHSDTLITGPSPFANLNNAMFHPFSDFALHHMGSNLADGIIQGNAGPDEFRSAPLWGLGQRLFFLHDGRTSDLLEVIAAHASPDDDCVSKTGESREFKVNGERIRIEPREEYFCGSEANAVVREFNHLNSMQKQDLLNFLRSL